MTAHTEHAKRQRLAVPCTAHHANYGGGCLNCGWTPDSATALQGDLQGMRTSALVAHCIDLQALLSGPLSRAKFLQHAESFDRYYSELERRNAIEKTQVRVSP